MLCKVRMCRYLLADLNLAVYFVITKIATFLIHCQIFQTHTVWYLAMTNAVLIHVHI